MSRFCGKAGLRAALLIAVLMIGAQSTALAHAYGHDPDALPKQPCPICVTAGQLGTACINTQANEVAVQCGSPLLILPAACCESFNALTARQRGPPASL